jgi:hypothetical protein
MNPSHRSRPPVGRQTPTPARPRKPGTPRPADSPAPPPPPLALPHERDETRHQTAAEPDPVMQQAKRDIDAGLVDTDMRATPGLDAALRARLVPGPGGKPARGKA